jgi:hypothetical protein
VQPKHAIDGVQFGGLYEFGMRDGDCEERTSSDFSQNARKSFSAGKFGNIS